MTNTHGPDDQVLNLVNTDIVTPKLKDSCKHCNTGRLNFPSYQMIRLIAINPDRCQLGSYAAALVGIMSFYFNNSVII
jgi:hypothetical protein